METIAIFIPIILIALVIFIIIRRFWLWYFRINELQNKLSEANKLLSEIRDNFKKPS